jgi:hypothetical protein
MVAAGRSHDDHNLCRSGTNKTGRDDNGLVTGTSDIGTFETCRMRRAMSELRATRKTYARTEFFLVCP